MFYLIASYLKRSKYLIHPPFKVFYPFIAAFWKSCCFAFYFLLIPLVIRSLDRKGKKISGKKLQVSLQLSSPVIYSRLEQGICF